MQPARFSSRRAILGGLALAILSGTVATRAGLARPPSPPQDPRPTLDGGTDWINTDRPIRLERLGGKVVLLDFWTYCCINCHHIIPTLTKLEEKYKNQLVVIGVHTAKFDAERVTDNIRKKVREYNIKHPVVNDADQVIWNNFGVSSWPTLVLVDSEGHVVAKEGGEVGFEALDRAVGALVRKAKLAGELDETPIQFFPEREKAHKGGLLFPGKVLADKEHGRLFIADTGHNRVVVTTLDGEPVATIGNGQEGLADGSYSAARFHRPQGMCLVGDHLYVADTEGHAIREVDLKAMTVRTLAGNGHQAEFGSKGGKGTHASLSSPWDVVAMPNTHSLAVAMAGLHQIWRVDMTTGDSRILAGNGAENVVDGSPAAAEFAQPSGLALDATHLFVADSEGSAVRAIDLRGANHRVTTVAGTHDLPRGSSLFAFGDKDGRGNAARLQHCLGLAFGDGKLFIADSYNNKVKVYDPATRVVETLIGSTRPGSTDNPPLLDEPGGLSVAGDSLYVADTNNHQIRVVSLSDRQVRTLAMTGLKPPVLKRVPTFANATVVPVEPVKAAPARSLAVSIALDLPQGYELNKEAPLTYLVESPGDPGALSAQNPATGGRIDPPGAEINLSVPLAALPEEGKALNLRVSVGAMVCLPNTLCTIRNFVWNVPITFSAGAPEKVSLSTK